MRGGIPVIIDVLRASTTITHALGWMARLESLLKQWHIKRRWRIKQGHPPDQAGPPAHSELEVPEANMAPAVCCRGWLGRLRLEIAIRDISERRNHAA